MYRVIFYKDRNGKEPVKEYLKRLSVRKDKDSRIKLNKIREYIKILSEYGTRAGEPYMKHLVDDLWELRPMDNRILFFAYDGKKFVLLSYFIKKTQKTPLREIAKAVKLMNEYKRGEANEKG